MENVILEHPYNLDDRIALLQLNRPKALNALNNQMIRELVESLEELDNNPKVRIIIITGDDRAFAAGADIKSLSESGAIDQLMDERAKLWKRFSLTSKPIIASVNGYCLGGGHELAMGCDLVIAGDRAKFGQPEINIGTIPGAGGTQRLTKLIGKSRAMLMTLTGEMISAQKAFDWGMLAKVVPAKTLKAETFEVAKKIAEKSPIATRLIKESINKSFEMSLTDGLDFERRNFYLTFASNDQKEGMSAFLEKRSPEYKGN